MDPVDVALRNATYHRFVELGRAPTAAEVAETSGVDVDTVTSGWRRLHDAHALVLDPVTSQLLMANPFAARPTPFRVEADGRGGTRTAHGMRSGSAPPWASTAASRRRVPIAVVRSL